jgi:hypothetical protein
MSWKELAEATTKEDAVNALKTVPGLSAFVDLVFRFKLCEMR